jgi:hypothetical protein
LPFAICHHSAPAACTASLVPFLLYLHPSPVARRPPPTSPIATIWLTAVRSPSPVILHPRPRPVAVSLAPRLCALAIRPLGVPYPHLRSRRPTSYPGPPWHRLQRTSPRRQHRAFLTPPPPLIPRALSTTPCPRPPSRCALSTLPPPLRPTLQSPRHLRQLPTRLPPLQPLLHNSPTHPTPPMPSPQSPAPPLLRAHSQLCRHPRSPPPAPS